jgi:hypothetical protein
MPSIWPYQTDGDLREAGYLFEGRARCRGCQAEIEWWRTPRGKAMPIDPGTMQPHWATCPKADDFRK